MSVGPLSGLNAGAAGTPLAQTKGSEADRAEHETGNQQRKVRNEVRAENASGIGQADGEDHETAERDADGRRLWEENPGGQKPKGPSGEDSPKSKDASGTSGTLLDLSG